MTFQNAKLFIIAISQRIRKGRRSCQLARERNELLLKTYAMWLADPQAALELLRHVSSFMQDAWHCLSKSKPALNRKVRGDLAQMSLFLGITPRYDGELRMNEST